MTETHRSAPSPASSRQTPSPPPLPQHDHHHQYDQQSQAFNAGREASSANNYCTSPILPSYEETVHPHGRRQVSSDVEQQAQEPISSRSGTNHQLQHGEKSTKTQQRKQILSYLCCICCPCFPIWMRCICCFFLFAIIAFAVAAGILAALFQMPTVTFNGTTEDPSNLPRFQNLAGVNGSAPGSFNINLGLNFTLTNPNVEGLLFEKIKAIAYYPTNVNHSFGGGNLTNLNVAPASITQFIFPFQIHYDPSVDPGYTILLDIMTKCGLLGLTQKQEIKINYDLKPTVRIIGVPISPVLHQSISFPCPLQAGQLTIPSGLSSIIPGL